MKALKKNSENLMKVANSICEVHYSSGKFFLDFASTDSVTLVSYDRTRIGSAVCSSIPSNWDWSVSIEDDCLYLYIWF